MRTPDKDTGPTIPGPFQQLMMERAASLADDRRLLPITINTAQQRIMAPPLSVDVTGDNGEGTIVSFQLDESRAAFNWRLPAGRLPGGELEWPVRMKITAAGINE